MVSNNQTFEITDFKSFESQKITFKRLTVLAGSNSVGKSTIIQALLLSRVAFEESIKSGNEHLPISIPLNGPYLLELGNTHEVVRHGKKISESIIQFKCHEGESPIFLLTLEANRTNQNRYDLQTKDYFFDKVHSWLLANHFYYLCAERIGPRLKYEYELIPYSNTGYRGERTLQLLSSENLSVDSKRLFKNQNPALLFAQARLWLDYIIPGASFDSATQMGRSKVIEATFKESLPTNVGFGISYVLPIIVNGLIAEPYTTFIVENPEAHLHPSGQTRIGQFLATIAGAGVQVITETHSEYVINGIRIASLDGTILNSDVIINFVSKEDNNSSTIKPIVIDESGDLSKYPKGFFDQEQTDIASIISYKRSKAESKANGQS